MTLPVQPLCGGDKPTSSPLRSRDSDRRRPACLSASWADPPLLSRRERRRAVCSWSVGYGTLSEQDELSLLPLSTQDSTFHKKGKVADQTTLLETRGRRLVTAPVIASAHAPARPAAPLPPRSRVDSLFAMPGIKSMLGGRRRPADQRGGADDDHALSPLVERAAAPPPEIVPVRPASSLASLRKCETVLALTGYLRSSSSSSSFEPVRPVNRLRGSQSRVCSRCSSLLTLASGSRYSLDSRAGGFARLPPSPPPDLPCKLCLAEVPQSGATRLQGCDCAFCTECMRAYVEFEIAEGSYDISCPDALCPSQGVLRQEEIKRLVGSDLLEKHNMYRLNREVELDQTRTWCPSAGCETVCPVRPSERKRSPQAVHCPTCARDFCSECKLEWHEGATCERAAARDSTAGIPFDSELIKCCPMCNVPIEKDEGCAQMMCKRCKHVFCWYCLASLDDDFLLRHYDKGPCKNKLGHSRASVIWHRTQVIGIFAGFGILLLVASPLLLLAAPCIVCCKCRICGGVNAKLDSEEEAAAEGS